MKSQITLKQKRTWTRVASLLTVLLSLISLKTISQEIWEFSNAGATGRFGPTQTQVDAEYAGTNLENNVIIFSQGIQEWTVPASGPYSIHALGAQGGAYNSNPGGLGADIQGKFNLTAGDVIQIAVGQMGTGGSQASGGGGASFIYNSTSGELLIAAGGGGGRSFRNIGAPNALATNNGDVGGLAGADNSAGGGGSFSNDGGSAQGFGGTAFLNGAEGGCGHYYGSCDENQGGFGGGGGGSWAGGNDGAGGGGGYSGGNGGAGGASDADGEGGGSFNGGTEQTNIGGANEGHGAVTITQLYAVSLISNTDATCPESADGSLSAEILGGAHPYTFTWSNGESNVVSDINTFTDQISDLAPGEYTVTVTDANGLETSGTFTVGPDPLEVTLDMTQTSTCDEAGDGVATANVSGGTAPYTYSWSSGEDTQSISNKSVGSYEVTVTDANNCVPAIESVEITADDDIAPVAQVQDIEVYLDANGQASIVADDVDNGSSDDCAITSLGVDVSEFTCDDVNAVPSFDGNTVLAFDGEDDYLEFDQVIPYAPNHTFAFWIRSPNNDMGTVFNWGGAGINNSTGIRAWSNRLRYSSVDGPGQTQTVNSSPFLNDNQWHHVVIVRNGSDVRIYLNGVLDVSGSITNSVTDPVHVTLGAGFLNNVYQGHMDCELDEFAYWPEALTQQVIEDMMCTGPQDADVFIDFETGSGTTSVADASENGNDATLHNMDASEDWIAFGEPKSLPSCPAGVKVQLSVTDAGGNLAEADAFVTVNDTISPVAQARAHSLELNENGEAVANALDFDDGSSDNCAIEGFEIDKTLFTCDDLGVNDVILTVDDIHGNSKSVGTQLTIEDNLAPTAVAQNITVELDENGFAAITAMDADNGSTDNCPIDSRELTINEFSCEDIGEVEVTMTVRDASGNESEAIFIANVVDNVGPSIPEELSMDVYLDANGEATFDTAPLIAEASDACGVENILFQSGEGNINPDGQVLSCEDVVDTGIPALAVDVNGNETEFTLDVSVQDTIKPLFYLESIEIDLDEEGNAILTEDMLLDYASDNCGLGEIIIQNGVFNCESVGVNQVVEITVIDMHGNEKQHSLDVAVNDQIAPEVSVQDVIIELDEDGQAVLDIENLDMALSENCMISQVLDQTQFDCTHLGTNSNLLTVTDAGGNNGVAEFNVSVIDNIQPVIEGPEQLTMCEGEVMHYRDFDVIDNCLATMEVVEGPLQGEHLDVGEYFIVLQAEDASGNVTTQLVNVSVAPSPSVDLGDDMEVESGELVTLVAGLSDENTYTWSTGDETASISFTAVESTNIFVDVVTPEGCRNGDNIFIDVFTPLSTDEDESGNAVSFFPNPTAGELNVSLSLTQNIADLQLTVMDISGKAVHQEIIPMAEDGQVINVNLSDLSDGIYLVNIQSESLNLTERIVKK